MPKNLQDSNQEKAAQEVVSNKQYKDLELQLQQIWKLRKSIAVYLIIVVISVCGAWIIVTRFLGEPEKVCVKENKRHPFSQELEQETNVSASDKM